MSSRLQPRVLEGEAVRLEPLHPALKVELAPALDADPEGWRKLTRNGRGAALDGWWDAALAEAEAGARIPYAIRHRPEGRVVGTTSFSGFRPAYRGVQIGATFLHPGARSGGRLNAEAKLLMLDEAFDNGAMRVDLWVHAANRASRASLERLGIPCEAVLHRHWITWTGEVCDTAVYAVTDVGWPAVRAVMEKRARQPGEALRRGARL